MPTDIIKHLMISLIEGERISMRLIQIVFAFGCAIVLLDITPKPFLEMLSKLFVAVPLLLISAFLSLFLHSQLEKEINSLLRQTLFDIVLTLSKSRNTANKDGGRDTTTNEENSNEIHKLLPHKIQDLLKFVHEVLFEDRNLVDDMQKLLLGEEFGFRAFVRCLKLLMPGLLQFALIVETILFILLNIEGIAHSDSLKIPASLGITLMAVSYITAIFYSNANTGKSGTPSSEAQTPERHTGIGSHIAERYFFKTAIKKHPLTSVLVTLLSFFLPVKELEIEAPAMWLGLYLCEGGMADSINQLTNREGVKLEVKVGNTTRFFQCSDTTSLEKWVEIHRISPIEMLRKVIQLEGKGDRELEILISKGNGESSELLAALIFKAWKGCDINRRLRKDNRNGYRIEANVERWRLVSVFIFGVREHVETLKQFIGSMMRPAKAENWLCIEEGR